MALAVALAVSGCGGGDDEDAAAPIPTPPADAPATSEAPPETPELPRNERGNVVRQLGEEIVLVPAADPAAPPPVTFTVQEIAVDPACDTEDPPVSGHYVVLRMSVSASPDYDPRVVAGLSEDDFTVLGPDGAAVEIDDSNKFACKKPEETVSNMRFPPGAIYTGWIVLDVPVSSGTLVYEVGGSAAGSEWQF